MICMRAWMRDHGLLLANVALFVIFFGGMVLTGAQAFSADPRNRNHSMALHRKIKTLAPRPYAAMRHRPSGVAAGCCISMRTRWPGSSPSCSRCPLHCMRSGVPPHTARNSCPMAQQQFRSGSSSAPQIDRGADDDRDGKEFALPVLERLEPELSGADELPDRNCCCAMGQLFLAVCGGTPDRMHCLLYTSPSPRDRQKSRMPSSA